MLDSNRKPMIRVHGCCRAPTRGMSLRAQLTYAVLTIGVIGTSADAQTSRAQSVALVARVAPIARIAVDQAAGNGPHFKTVPISSSEVEIVLDPATANPPEISIPLMLSSNTRSYTLQALCDTAEAGEIEIKNAGELGQEIFGRARTLQGQVTFAMGTAKALKPLRTVVQIRVGSNARATLRIRLRIQPL